MIKNRILATLKFFTLQDYPLTLHELYQYLITDLSLLFPLLDKNLELKPGVRLIQPKPVALSDLIFALEDLQKTGDVVQVNGIYCLASNEELIEKRQLGYLYGLKREQLIRRYLSFTRHLPFVRGVALAGSQALGLKKPASDIDLLIFTDKQFMWLARTILTVYFHLLGIRRYRKKIADRFCLNHYLAHTGTVETAQNLYTAMEYAKLRPIINNQQIKGFQQANLKWINIMFPNMGFIDDTMIDTGSLAQNLVEFLLRNRFGLWLNQLLAQVQIKRINQDKFVMVKQSELSFHPDSKQEFLLREMSRY